MNKVIIVGNLGKNPDVKVTQTGGTIARISVATERVWADKRTGEKKKDTQWHNVSFFGATATIVEKYLKKGSKVCVEGYLKTDKWVDKAGMNRSGILIVGERLEMLGSRMTENTESIANQFDNLDNIDF